VGDPSRRDVLRLAGVTALAISCGDNLTSKPPGDSAGSAIFEPTEGSFLVSAWLRYASSVIIEVSDGLTVVQTAEAKLVNAQAVAEITGLSPSTEYQVTITANDATQFVHTVRTAPALDDVRPIRLAVSADLDPQPAFESDLFEQIIASEPEVFVTIGDVPYTDNGPPAQTVEVYRERHGDLRTAKHVRGWFEAMGIRSIYDDHEFRNDWDGVRALAEPDRYAAAMQVWDEFFPLAATAPVDDVRYRTFRWGALVECFVLDCRRFRSGNDIPDDANKTMLGATQKAWFKAALAASTATWKLVFTSIPLDYGLGDDHWASFTTEREELFSAIKALGTTGILFLSGDQHYFAAYSHSYGLREFQVGPLARGLGTIGRQAPGVLFRDVRYNFGLLDISPDTLTMSGVGPGGDVFYKETFSPSMLTAM
jgi:phosphodiesterase/alkaline phosphatase D-like protein